MATPPLNPQVRIVDEQGRPTPEFIRWAQAQRDVNQDIPTTPQSVSGVLDKLGDTRGSLLYRGVSNWAALVPGLAGRFLRSNGAGTDPSWQSAAFTDLSDAPSSYTGEAGQVVAVNGTEDGLEFITPSGGGGEGYHAVNFGAPIVSLSSSAYATKGNIFTPGLSFKLYTVSVDLDASQTVMVTLAEVNSSNVITSILWQSSPQVVGGSRRDVYYTGLGGITLSAGTRYALMATRTDGTTTSVLGIPFEGSATYPNLPMGTVYVANIRYASTSPSVSDSIALDEGPAVNAARFRLGMAFTP